MINPLNPPSIPLLRFRHFLGERDYPEVARVLTTSEMADHSIRDVDADDIAKAYQHMPNCDPYRDIIFAEVEGVMVGYSRGWWEDGPSSERWYNHNGFLIPEYRRQGIGSAMLTWMESRLSQRAAAHPAELVKFFQVNVSQFQTGTASMLEHSGYQPIRRFYEMVRPTLENIVESPLPDGLELRPVLPDQLRAIWDPTVETSQDEWGQAKMTEADYQEWLKSPLFQPELWQVAWDKITGQAVGHVLTYIHHAENKQFNRRRGYTEGIGVLREWRGRGVARALIGRSLLAQKAAGMTESALVVDTENASNASRLYESCGFQIIKCDTLYRKPMPQVP